MAITTPNLGLTYLEIGQKDKTTTINTNMALIDSVLSSSSADNTGLLVLQEEFILPRDYFTGSPDNNGTLTFAQGTTNHPGVMEIITNDLSGTPTSPIFWTFATAHPTNIDISTVKSSTYIAKLDVTIWPFARIGLVSSVSGLTGTTSPASGSYFEVLSSDTNWQAVTRNSGTQTRTNTGVAKDTSWHRFKIVRDGTTDFKFYIDNNLVATNTTNLVTSGFVYGYIGFLPETGTYVERKLSVDYVDVIGTVSR